MIIRPAEIYKRASEKNSLDLDVVVSVGESVFGELLKLVNDPKDLAYELDHVGTFILRHKSFLTRLASARRFSDQIFEDKYAHIEKMIEDYKTKKMSFKQFKYEYRQNKALQQS